MVGCCDVVMGHDSFTSLNALNGPLFSRQGSRMVTARMPISTVSPTQTALKRASGEPSAWLTSMHAMAGAAHRGIACTQSLWSGGHSRVQQQPLVEAISP